ncbi:RNA polymerase Rpb7-like domain-containing protein [Diplocarpon rosae]|nr:RNA polymerase Rpb7-like domain-containing protein [Diplocarpon rosae]
MASKSKKHKSDKRAAHSEALKAPSTVSPFHLQTSSLYLPLAPVSQKFPLEGICAEHLSPLLLTYYPPFKGNEGHLGLVCWNLFNASIERKRLPSNWEWRDVADAREGHEGDGETYAEEGAGYYVDGEATSLGVAIEPDATEVAERKARIRY